MMRMELPNCLSQETGFVKGLSEKVPRPNFLNPSDAAFLFKSNEELFHLMNDLKNLASALFHNFLKT